VCFDNVYDDPYTTPVREGRLDFHLVCSNEAWYERSYEYDQMVAFSRLIAIETGRTVVRATNAGISVVLDPAGREVARLEGPGGEDRMVAGTLAVVVPVPDDPGAEATPFVRFERVLIGAWLGLPFLLGFSWSGEVTPRTTEVRPHLDPTRGSPANPPGASSLTWPIWPA
jgi:apolipoprotein N-acyltransferase